MLERFLEEKPTVCANLFSSQVIKCGYADGIRTLNERDITHAEEIAMTLKPMKDATNILSEGSTPILSVIALLHVQLLLDTQADFCDKPVVHEVKIKLSMKI